MASLSNRVSIDTNVIFLRNIFAFSTNNVPVSTNFIMGAGPSGQIYAQDTLRNLETYGVGYLPSTFSTIDGQIASTSLQLISGNVTAPALTSTTNYLLSTICSVQSNVDTLSSGLSSVIGSTFTSFGGQFSSLNSSFEGFVSGTSVTGAQLTSTTDSLLSTMNIGFSTLSTSIGSLTATTVTPIAFSNLSTGISTQSNYFSVQVVQLSNNFSALSNFTRIQLSNQSSQISSLNATVISFGLELASFSSAAQDPDFIIGLLSTKPTVIFGSTIVASSLLINQSTLVAYGGRVGIACNAPTVALDIGGSLNFSGLLTSNGTAFGIVTAAFTGLSTFVLGQSTTIRNISDSLSTNIINTSNVSTFVLGQSTTVRNISDSLSANIINTSNVSTFVVTLSTSVGARFDSGSGITAAQFQGLSTFVLGQSTTIRNVSDSLSANIINTSNVSTFVVTLSTSVGARFDSGGGGGGGGGTTISTSINYGTANLLRAQNGLIGGTSNIININASNSVVIGFSNTANGIASQVFGTNNIAGGTNAFVTGNLNTGSADHSITVGQGNQNNASGGFSYIFGLNNTVQGGTSGAFGFGNVVNGTGTTTALIAGGTSNIINAFTSNTLVAGTFGKGRMNHSFAYASGAMSTVREGYNFTANGASQTVTMTLYGVQPATALEVPLFYGVSPPQSNLIVMREQTFGFTRTPSSNFHMHTVNVGLTGYVLESGLGLTGNGFFFGRYRFFTYWDAQSSRVAHVCDNNGSTTATSGGNITLTAIESVNRLTDSGGAKTVTVRVYMTSNTSNINYAITANSSGPAINWLAQLQIGELSAAYT